MKKIPEEDRIKKEIGFKIALARKASGLTQHKLSKRMKLSRVSISNIEAGRQTPSILFLMRFSDCVGISMFSLLKDVGNWKLKDELLDMKLTLELHKDLDELPSEYLRECIRMYHKLKSTI